MSEKTVTYCRYLRGKNAYGTLEGGDRPIIPVDPGTTSYWCIRTAGPVGPDDSPVYPAACIRHERKCFAPPGKEEKRR